MAFTSLYSQAPGLYGRDGILPIHRLLPLSNNPLEKFVADSPTLLWFMPRIGLDPGHGFDLFCVMGIALASLTLVWERLRSSLSYFVLWLLYLSLYQVGQTFLWFQWDILLLETGFLAIIVAPLFGGRPSSYNVGLWLVKWLLFRLMFASGVVKLTSHCPTWWGLTALDYHFESQCIPLPLAWYFHHSPEWFRRLSVVGTYIIEIVAPFFFFAPVRNLRLLSFWLQVLFQVFIIFTGNYNFFNLLTCVLCLPLLDDAALVAIVSLKKLQVSTPAVISAASRIFGGRISSLAHKVVRRFAFWSVCAVTLYWTSIYFDIRVNTPNSILETNIAFSKSDFSSALHYIMPLTIWIGVFSLAVKLIQGVRYLTQQSSVFSVIGSLGQFATLASVAIYMFAISLVPHTVLDKGLQTRLWPVVHQWHQQSTYYHLTSSYGLFRSMTGVGGRPEVILEGSNDLNANWKEYTFLYKPGNLSARPPIVAPHQPRLDWQMWFAALGSYQHNPWLISLVDRLLVGEQSVLDLLGDNPFPSEPPKYIRGKLFHYHFTKPSSTGHDWWTREEVSEYFPPLAANDKSVTAFLEHHNLRDRNFPHRSDSSSDHVVNFLQVLRQHTSAYSGLTLIGMVLFAIVVLRLTLKLFY